MIHLSTATLPPSAPSLKSLLIGCLSWQTKNTNIIHSPSRILLYAMLKRDNTEAGIVKSLG